MDQKFETFLENHSLNGLSSVSKSDLHNHFGKGGNINYITAKHKFEIEPVPSKFDSLAHMDDWFYKNIKTKCPYLDRIEAAFVQVAADHVKVLSAGFGYYEDMGAFIQSMKNLNQQFAPNTILLPELALNRNCNVDEEYSRLDEIFSYNWFKSIDIIGEEFDQPIKNFKKIYEKAKAHGLRLKAHVGEFGTADDVMAAVETLELDEVQHGIASSQSQFVMSWLSKHDIQLNVCPSSNIMLGVVESYAAHPIRRLYDNGIPVTINTDDMLVFNQSVSQEFLNLYKVGLMDAKELNHIRRTGLKQLDYFEARL